MDDEDGKDDGKGGDLTEAVVVAILKCLTSEVVKLTLLQWVVLMMMMMMMMVMMIVMLVMIVVLMVMTRSMKRMNLKNEDANLKKSAVEVCNVDNTAARFITTHLAIAAYKKDFDQNTCFQPQALQTS